MQTIIILDDVRTARGSRSSLYYYAGNFFWPALSLHGADVSRVTRAIRTFIKENRDLILADRARPDYFSYEQLFDVLPYDDEPARFVPVSYYDGKVCTETEIGSYGP